MNRTLKTILLLFLAGAISVAASELQVKVVARFNKLPLEFDSLTTQGGNSDSVTRLDFLLSDFALHRVDGPWVNQTNWQAYLSLREKRSSFSVENIPTGRYDRMRFHVGVVSPMNHSDPARYSAGHPLNPTVNGMHWGWANGYVFFAVEGNWRTPEGKISGYSYHLGNDPQLMTVDIPADLNFEQNQALTLLLDLDHVLNFKIGGENSSTHSRKGDEFAAHLAKNVEQSFRILRSAPSTNAATEVVAKATIAAPMHPYHFSFSAQFPIPELPRDNPLSEEGVELGHHLFGEKLLSVNNRQSCASCHRAESAFAQPGRPISIGAEGDEGERNAMPIFNLAWKKSFFWDGRAASLREQALMPIQNPIEMHESMEHVVNKLSRKEGYPEMFKEVFGTLEITAQRIGLALEQFMLAQTSYDSKFDRALDGKEQMTEEEKRGFQLFVTEYDPRREQFGADCFHCHGGPLFQSQSFANNGLDAKFVDVGLFKVTGREGDRGKFAVPSLRNVAITGPYMHDGRFDTLEEVIDHYTTGVKRSATLDPNIAKHPDGGVPLKAEDKKALVAFLKTLTDYKYSAERRGPPDGPPGPPPFARRGPR